MIGRTFTTLGLLDPGLWTEGRTGRFICLLWSSYNYNPCRRIGGCLTRLWSVSIDGPKVYSFDMLFLAHAQSLGFTTSEFLQPAPCAS